MVLTCSSRSERRTEPVSATPMGDRTILGFLITAAVRHWLATTGLLLGIHNVYPKAFKHLEGGDSHLGIEHIDLARDHESDFHAMHLYLALNGACCHDLSCQGDPADQRIVAIGPSLGYYIFL
jgi:hypothetical protein